MKALRLTLGLLLVVVVGQGAGTATGVKNRLDEAQASYVRICKDRRGIRDRRACGGKDDPRRTVLAFANSLRPEFKGTLP